MGHRARTTHLFISVVGVLALAACSTYHTTYTNLHAPGHDPVVDEGALLEEAGFFDGWEHFWVFGLLPFESGVDTAAECGSERVEQVRTYQSGLQFLLANVQGAFIFVNVWSPYTAKVDCARTANAAHRREHVDLAYHDAGTASLSFPSTVDPVPGYTIASNGYPLSSDREEQCVNACVEADRACVATCGEHRNPMECDAQCRRTESDCRHDCRR